jgi:hypothetical protein
MKNAEGSFFTLLIRGKCNRSNTVVILVLLTSFDLNLAGAYLGVNLAAATRCSNQHLLFKQRNSKLPTDRLLQ